jgi:serine/threonine protein kinase
MTTAISIEDVRREVKILKALSGHKHLIKFHDACEDANNVYIVMEYVYSVLLLMQNMFKISKIVSLFLFSVFLLACP